MTIFDIVVCVLAVIALINGWRRGFAVQAFGLVAIIIGIFVAMRTGAEAGVRFGIDPKYAAAAGFLIIFLCVTVGLLIVGHLFRSLFKFAGLGMLDSLLGIIFSLLKAALVLGILCSIFDRFNEGAHFIPRENLDRSLTYRPLCNVVDGIGILGKSLEQGTERVVEKTLDAI